MSDFLDKEWYTTGEAERITGYSYKTFSMAIKRGIIVNYKKDRGILLLHKDEVARYLEQRILSEYNPVYGEVGDQEWFSVKQAEIVTGIHFQTFSKLIRQGKLINFKTVLGCKYIHREVVINMFAEKSNVLSKYLLEDDVAEILGKTVGAIKSMKFKDTTILRGRRYISKIEVEDLKSSIEGRMKVTEAAGYLGLGRYFIEDLINKGILESYQKNNYLRYISRRSVLEFESSIAESFDYKKLANLTQISESELISLEHIGVFQAYHSSKHGTIIIQADVDKAVAFLNKYYTMAQIESIYGILPGVVKKNMIFTNEVSYQEMKGMYVIEKESFNNFLASINGIKIRFHGTNDYQGYINELMPIYIENSAYKETMRYYFEWVKMKIKTSESKRKKLDAGCYLITAEHLNKLLTKELKLYSDAEIQELVEMSEILTMRDIENISFLMKDLLKKTECKFINEYLLVPKRDRVKEINEVIYSKFEWTAMCGKLCDVVEHMEKAIANRRYAETWLYLLMHLSLAWRKSDFRKIKNVPIELAEVTEFGWFEENVLSLEKGQLLINEMRRRGIGIKTDKTKMNTHLVIALILPTAVALIIAEIHSRIAIKDKGILFSAKGYRSYDFKKVLGDKLPSFASKKTNASLLTYGFETATKIEGRAAIAYALSSHARSHLEKIGAYSETTKKYLHLLGTDVNVSDMAKHLFERGFFGWQIGLMLDMVISTDLWELKEKTEQIKEFGNKMAPMCIENLSKYVHTRYQQYNDLLDELMHLTKEEIMTKLTEIVSYKSPALIDYSQCIKGIDNCVFNNPDACLGCKYHIPTNYILEIIKAKLDSLMEKFEGCHLGDVQEKMKLSHILDQLLFIVTDFRIAFKNFDENYFNSFIEYDDLKLRIEKLENVGLIYLEE